MTGHNGNGTGAGPPPLPPRRSPAPPSTPRRDVPEPVVVPSIPSAALAAQSPTGATTQDSGPSHSPAVSTAAPAPQATEIHSAPPGLTSLPSTASPVSPVAAAALPPAEWIIIVALGLNLFFERLSNFWIVIIGAGFGWAKWSSRTETHRSYEPKANDSADPGHIAWV